jgi:sugar transferase (PEP-CTERM/EpsH1 system associated)
VRCLVLSPFVPYPPEDGGRIRIFEIVRRLSERHDVTVLALVDRRPEAFAAVERLRTAGIDIHPVRQGPQSKLLVPLRAWRIGRSLYLQKHVSPEFARTLDAYLTLERFDIVQCEFSYMGMYAPEGAHVGRPRWMLDAHNVEFRLNQTLAQTTSGLSGFAYRRYAAREGRLRRVEEVEACRRADRVVAVSTSDREILRTAIPGLRVDVVPNGVDLDHFVPSNAPESGRRPSALFVGKMDYRPNVDAVCWFCREVLPLVKRRVPGFTFTICGGHPSRSVLELAQVEGVRVTGHVPDTRVYLDDAAVSVVPLRAGSGTRLKMLEAMAMGRPVVSTPIGAEGLDVVSGEHFAEAVSPREFASSVVALLENSDERDRLGRAGRRLVEASYGWPAVVSRLEGVYEEVLSPSAVELAG